MPVVLFLRTDLMCVFSGRCRSCLAQKRLLQAQYLLEVHNLVQAHNGLAPVDYLPAYVYQSAGARSRYSH